MDTGLYLDLSNSSSLLKIRQISASFHSAGTQALSITILSGHTNLPDSNMDTYKKTRVKNNHLPYMVFTWYRQQNQAWWEQQQFNTISIDTDFIINQKWIGQRELTRPAALLKKMLIIDSTY